jgi:hypothetical protein
MIMLVIMVAAQQRVNQASPRNNRFKRDAPTAGFAACFRAHQAKR